MSGVSELMRQRQPLALRGANDPVQLPNCEVDDKGMVLKRPLGSGAMLIGSSAVEVNYPLSEDRELRLFPGNSSEIFVVGVAGDTLHLVIDRATH